MVIGDDAGDHGGHNLPLTDKFLVELLDELVDPELIRDGGVVRRIHLTGPGKNGLRNGEIGKESDAGLGEAFLVKSRLKHHAKSKVVKIDFVALEMFPHRSRFVVIFRIDGTRRPIHG